MRIDTSKEPTLEEYSLADSIYEEYTQKTKKLEELQKTIKHPIFDTIGNIVNFIDALAGFYLLIFFYVVISWLLDQSYDKSNITPEMIYWAFIASFLLVIGWLFNSSIGLNILTFGKHKKELRQVEKSKEKLEESIDSIKKRVGDFEKALTEYHRNQINHFFETNLYRKRSGGEKFKKDLLEFASMLDEADKIDKILITNRIGYTYLRQYKDYLKDRQIRHLFTKNTNNFEVRARSQFVNKIIEAKKKKEIPPEILFKTPRILDWEAINKKRKITGLRGEEIVLTLEQEYLKSIERNDLAKKVKHVSIDQGDGLGYDILSFFPDGKEKYIEVKASAKSINNGYYLSRNELNFLSEHKNAAFIYRVQNNDKNTLPELQVYRAGDVLNSSQMTPVQYLVRMN